MSLLDTFKSVDYVQCSCGLPGCAIRIAVEPSGEVWLSMDVSPKGWRMRLKAAWWALTGRPYGWSECVLTDTQCTQIATILHNAVMDNTI